MKKKLTADKLLKKHGICKDCGEMYSRKIDEPIVSCGCGQEESCIITPYQELELEIYQLQCLVVRLHLGEITPSDLAYCFELHGRIK